MNLYLYEGPVMVLGKLVTGRWKYQTFAASEKKAMTNMAYRYKKQHGLMATAKVELPGELVLAKEDV